jgi:hypothetical protein
MLRRREALWNREKGGVSAPALLHPKKRKEKSRKNSFEL